MRSPVTNAVLQVMDGVPPVMDAVFSLPGALPPIVDAHRSVMNGVRYKSCIFLFFLLSIVCLLFWRKSQMEKKLKMLWVRNLRKKKKYAHYAFFLRLTPHQD